MDTPIIIYTPQKNDIVINENEVYRYLGYTQRGMGRTEETDANTKNNSFSDMQDGSSKAIREYIREALALTQEAMQPKACYGRFTIDVKGDGKILFPYGEVVSHDLTKNLHDCKEIFLFAATLGVEFDRLLRRTRITSMTKAAVLQAAGAAAVEGLCDQLNDDLRKAVEAEGYKAHPRYSPGYGDYALENQKGIFDILKPSKNIGVSLMDTLIMAPEKSVTAVIGLEQI